MTKPVILIPGLPGTILANTNTANFEPLSGFLDSQTAPIYDLRLQDDAEFDLVSGAIVERSHIETIAYASLISNLKRDLETNVYIFGYDWRRSCVENAHRLLSFTDYLRRKRGDLTEPYNFVCHSTGGLIFSCFLKLLAPNYSVIDRVVLGATPLKGTVRAFVELVKGESEMPLMFWRRNSNEDFRKVARTFPALYELSPVYQNAIQFDASHPLAPTPFSLWDRNHWQTNLFDDGKGALMDKRLQSLQQFHNGGAMLELSLLPPEVRQRIIILAGVGDTQDTRAYLNVLESDSSLFGGIFSRASNFVDFDHAGMEFGDGLVALPSIDLYANVIDTFKIKQGSFRFDFDGNILDNIASWAAESNFLPVFHPLFFQISSVQKLTSRFLRQKPNFGNGAPWWTEPGGANGLVEKM